MSVFNNNRRTFRSPTNPLDKSTVISIYPKKVNVTISTVQPPSYEVQAGSLNLPTILIVGPASWWRDIDPEQPLLEITCSSIQIADSIVNDYSNGLFMCNMGDCRPGLFYIPGPHNVPEILKDYPDLLKDADKKQRNWYQKLVAEADSLFARTNGNPLAISDDMRMAAHELNLKEKAWMQDFTMMEMKSCPACGSMIKPGFPVCANCHNIINQKLYDELKLKSA